MIIRWLFIRFSSSISSHPHNRWILMIINGEHKFHLRYGNPVTDKNGPTYLLLYACHRPERVQLTFPLNQHSINNKIEILCQCWSLPTFWLKWLRLPPEAPQGREASTDVNTRLNQHPVTLCVMKPLFATGWVTDWQNAWLNDWPTVTTCDQVASWQT